MEPQQKNNNNNSNNNNNNKSIQNGGQSGASDGPGAGLTFQGVSGEAQLADDVAGDVGAQELALLGVVLRSLQEVVELLRVELLQKQTHPNMVSGTMVERTWRGCGIVSLVEGHIYDGRTRGDFN
jgi:hypothetical protein